MTRESDFDDYTRSRIFASMAAEARQCPTCGNFDSMRLAKGDAATVVHDGKAFEVEQFVCVACALADMVQRNFRAISENVEPQKPGGPTPADGRKFIARQMSESNNEPEVT